MEKTDLKKITTSCGFTCHIDPTTFDDMEFLELVGETENENPLALPKVITALLGSESKKALYEHLKKIHGRVPIKECGKIIAEIFNLLGEDIKK